MCLRAREARNCSDVGDYKSTHWECLPNSCPVKILTSKVSQIHLPTAANLSVNEFTLPFRHHHVHLALTSAILLVLHMSARVWNLSSGLCSILQGHKGDVSCVAISPDGRTILSAAYDRTVR